MLPINRAVRTFIAWITLFFSWSAYVMWFHGHDVLRVVMQSSYYYAFDLAMKGIKQDIAPPGLVSVLVTLVVLSTGALLSSVTLLCWNLMCDVTGANVRIGKQLLIRTGLIRQKPFQPLK